MLTSAIFMNSFQTLVVSFILLSTLSIALPQNKLEYMRMRAELINTDENMRIGSNLVLTASEHFVNEIFMKEKRNLIESSRLNRTVFFPSASFFQSRPLIEQSLLYQLIHTMPKGASLHIHDQSMVSLDWIIKNVTYRDNVYMCLWQQSYLIFQVFKTMPLNPDCDWKLVVRERQLCKDVAAFDLNLRNNLSLVVNDPFVNFPDNQAAWVKFSQYFRQVGQLLYFIPIFKDMLWQTMMEFREANILYMEVRVTYAGLYDLEGNVYNREYCTQLVKEVSEAFSQHYPDFIGMKIIFSGIRFQNESDILDEVKDVMTLHKKYPDIVAGYDLSGNEAYFRPLHYYSDALMFPSQQDPSYRLPYFLHAGETNWQGTETGYNIVDALLLNATRVGHAYALSKHPHLMKLYKERDIPIEVQPLSNQVLRLISDFRNHPMVSLIADNFSIVISCDDRTTMDSAPLSHDFYIVFTAMSSDKADITLLKQLALNSIRFSTLNDSEKERAQRLWQTKWDKFINEVPSVTSIPTINTSPKPTNPSNNLATLDQPWTAWCTILVLISMLELSHFDIGVGSII